MTDLIKSTNISFVNKRSLIQLISEYKIPYTYELWYSEIYNTHNKY